MKITFFYGPENTGKSMVARAIGDILVGKDKTVYLSGWLPKGKMPPFFFNACDENTELIIIDDCDPKMNFDFVHESIKNGYLTVNRKNRQLFNLYNVSIILTTNTEFQQRDECFEYVKFPIH